MKSICTGMLSAWEKATNVFTAPLSTATSRRVPSPVILTDLRGQLRDFTVDLSLADQLMVNLILDIRDFHASHLGTRE